MRTRGIVVLFLFSLMLVVFVGCGNDRKSMNDNGEKEDAEATISMRASSEFPVDDPRTEALELFAEKVLERTDGKIEIEVYPAGQLGDYLEVYNEVAQGTIEMALITVPSELDKRLELTFVPFMATGYDDLERVYNKDSYVFKTLEEVHRGLGVKLLGFNASGFGGVGTIEPVDNILNVEEDKGIVIRTPVPDVFNQTMKDIGFRTMTLPYSDLYTALQTGTVEGWSGGEPSLNYSGFRDVINHFYQTNEFLGATSFVINEELFNSLTEKEQEIIQEIADENTLQSFEKAEEIDQHYRDLMEEEGIEVVEFTDEEIASLAQHVRETTWPKLEESIGKEIMQDLKEFIDH